MSASTQPISTELRSLTTICEELLERHGVTVPKGHIIGARTARSAYGFRWRDGLNTAPGPIVESHKGNCPSLFGDGICFGRTWAAMSSGGHSASGGLLVVSTPLSAILSDPKGDKIRARKVTVRLRWWVEEANLRGANLRGADLRDSRGVLHPPINDPRGYRCVAVWHPDGWMIAAGCRYFTVEGALAHWGADYRGDRAIGDAYLFAVRLVAERPTEETRGVL